MRRRRAPYSHAGAWPRLPPPSAGGTSRIRPREDAEAMRALRRYNTGSPKTRSRGKDRLAVPERARGPPTMATAHRCSDGVERQPDRTVRDETGVRTEVRRLGSPRRDAHRAAWRNGDSARLRPSGRVFSHRGPERIGRCAREAPITSADDASRRASSAPTRGCSVLC